MKKTTPEYILEFSLIWTSYLYHATFDSLKIYVFPSLPFFFSPVHLFHLFCAVFQYLPIYASPTLQVQSESIHRLLQYYDCNINIKNKVHVLPYSWWIYFLISFNFFCIIFCHLS